MGGINVKNTMIETLMQIIAPHPCSSCGKVGTLLCHDCKYDIIREPFLGCFVCGSVEKRGICMTHGSPIEFAHIIGQRESTLEALINGLKFQNVKHAALPLAELLNETLPILPEGTVIVPIPTVSSHIRQRGYDQVELVARHLARLRGLPIEHILMRRNKATQHTVGRAQRQTQAGGAFSLSLNGLSTNGPLLILDDVITTGSTVLAAADTLSPLNRPMWVAALAYQTLD